MGAGKRELFPLAPEVHLIACAQKFIEMTTGTAPTSPLSWEYTTETQAQRTERQRLCLSFLAEGTLSLTARSVSQGYSKSHRPSVLSGLLGCRLPGEPVLLTYKRRA